MSSSFLSLVHWQFYNRSVLSFQFISTAVMGIVSEFLSVKEYTNWVQTEHCVHSLTRNPKLLANSCYITRDILEATFGWTKALQREYIVFDNDGNCTTQIELRRDLSPLQLKQNLLITGSAGVGKTHAIKKIIAYAKEIGLKFQTTATTGAACTILPDCRTLHSFSGLGKGTITMAQLRQLVVDNRLGRFKRWKDIDLLIIDEFGMLGARTFEKVNYAAQIGRNNFAQPFGGIQVVVVADFLQLVPIGDHMAFESPLWSQLNFTIFYLKQIYRQRGDPAFRQLCERGRMGKQTPADIEMLQSHVVDSREFVFKTLKPIQLFSDHASVY